MTRRATPLLWALLALWPAVAAAQPVITDVSKSNIAITADFTGAELLFFGSTEGDGKLVVVIQGPDQEISIRRKKRVAGIWVNGDEVVFESAPSFYHVIASESLDEWLPLTVREANQIGVEYLAIDPVTDVGPAAAADYRAALIRNKQDLGHYSRVEGRLRILGGRLFRSELYLPSNVPTGTYTIKTFLVRDRQIVSTQVTPLTVDKSGLEEDIYRVAHQHSILYGLAAIAIAVLAGLGGNAMFRRT